MNAGTLYFGDCLEVMREEMPDACVDLIYADPPFNSKRLYNAYIGGAQWEAFNDTWRPVEHPMPEPIPDTPENVARAIMQNPPKKEWRYLKESGRKR